MDPTNADRSRRGGLFPVPHRSWTTQRGNRVSVGGCCLPLPIGCLATSVALAGVAVKVAWRAQRA